LLKKKSSNSIKESFKKSSKLKEFLELHVRKPSRRYYQYHLLEYSIYTKILNSDTYLKDKSQYVHYRDRLKYQEDRLKTLEHLVLRLKYDDYMPFEGPRLIKEERKFEDELEDKILLEKDRKLRYQIATDSKYKNSEIFYMDRTYNSNGTIRSFGQQFLIKKDNRTDEEKN